MYGTDTRWISAAYAISNLPNGITQTPACHLVLINMKQPSKLLETFWFLNRDVEVSRDGLLESEYWYWLANVAATELRSRCHVLMSQPNRPKLLRRNRRTSKAPEGLVATVEEWSISGRLDHRPPVLGQGGAQDIRTERLDGRQWGQAETLGSRVATGPLQWERAPPYTPVSSRWQEVRTSVTLSHSKCCGYFGNPPSLCPPWTSQGSLTGPNGGGEAYWWWCRGLFCVMERTMLNFPKKYHFEISKATWLRKSEFFNIDLKVASGYEYIKNEWSFSNRRTFWSMSPIKYKTPEDDSLNV